MTAYIVPYPGERIDVIAKALLQTERDGTVEALLDANPGLSARLQNGFASEGEVIVSPENFTLRSKVSTFTLAWE